MRRIAIVGGGISGLSAAHRLVELAARMSEPFEVLVLEASPRLGGVIRTEHRDDFLLELGPDAFISEKPEAVELAKRIGLAEELIETNKTHRRSFIVRKGKLSPVPAGFYLLAPSRLWPFVTSDVFSWKGKARIALDLLLPRARAANGDESLPSFVRRRFGSEALERMAQPMLGGIYAADPEKLSLSATMPRFVEMERKHRSLIRALRKKVDRSSAIERPELGASGARYGLFLSFRDGMQMLVDRLPERILDCGLRIADSKSSSNSILLNSRVESVTLIQSGDDGKSESIAANNRHARRWKIKTDKETIIADAVCLAVPTYAAARLLHEVDATLAGELEAIPYASTATINLGYLRKDIPNPLDGFGFVVPFVEKRTLMACTFSGVKFAGRAPEGHALLRAFVGGALQPEIFELDEDEMVRCVRNDLRKLLGIEKPPLLTQVKKWPCSIPQYHVGHLKRIERIERRVAALPGLALAGNAFYGPGIPDCIRSGELAAERVLGNR